MFTVFSSVVHDSDAIVKFFVTASVKNSVISGLGILIGKKDILPNVTLISSAFSKV